MNTKEIIGDLLIQHNCVIIPSFGGFVAKRVGAKVDFQSGRMLPPSKSILFNVQLIQNDGLLINEMARKNAISFDEAKQQLKLEVAEWEQNLQDGKRIEIEKVGTLHLDTEKNVCFEQDRFTNLLMESFGLSTVNFLVKEYIQKIEEKVAEETPVIPLEPVISSDFDLVEDEKVVAVQPVETETSETEIALPKNKRKIWKYAAAACLLPVAFYSVWIPTQTQFLESGLISSKDFNPFYQQKTGKYSSKDIILPEVDKFEIPSFSEQITSVRNSKVEAFPFQFDEDTYILVRTENVPEVKEKTEKNNTEKTEIKIDSPSKKENSYEFIVGCFSQKTNALKLVQELQSKDLEGRIVDIKNGLHRVSAGGGKSSQEIQQTKLKVSELGYSGWILQ